MSDQRDSEKVASVFQSHTADQNEVWDKCVGLAVKQLENELQTQSGVSIELASFRTIRGAPSQGSSRVQDVYNDRIRNSHNVVTTILERTGRYSTDASGGHLMIEEINIALSSRRDTGGPQVLVYLDDSSPLEPKGLPLAYGNFS